MLLILIYVKDARQHRTLSYSGASCTRVLCKPCEEVGLRGTVLLEKLMDPQLAAKHLMETDASLT